MKKSIIIWSIAIILLITAFYVTKNYNIDANSKNAYTQNENVQNRDTDNAQNPNNNENKDTTESTQSNDSISSNENSQKDANTVETVYPLALDFTLQDLDGNNVTLSSFKGKKVFLNFWATWCPPCKAEMPDIQKLYEETKDTDIVILAVNLGEDKNTVKSFLDKNNYSFKVLLDSQDIAGTLYQIQYIPTSYFINSQGEIVNTFTGALTYKAMKNYINEL